MSDSIGGQRGVDTDAIAPGARADLRLLVVECDDSLRDGCVAVLRGEGYAVTGSARDSMADGSLYPFFHCRQSGFRVHSTAPTMLTDKIQQLNEARAKMEQLQQNVAAELTKELAGLPAAYGFDNVEAFVAAVRAASGKRRGRKAWGVAKTAGGKRRKRALITDDTRAQVKKLAEGGKTGNEIAKSLGISLPSVQNIKKALGLVKARK